MKTGESATLTVTIKGTGNIMDAALPALNLDTAKFKVYEDTPAQDVQVTEQGFTGQKVVQAGPGGLSARQGYYPGNSSGLFLIRTQIHTRLLPPHR